MKVLKIVTGGIVVSEGINLEKKINKQEKMKQSTTEATKESRKFLTIPGGFGNEGECKDWVANNCSITGGEGTITEFLKRAAQSSARNEARLKQACDSFNKNCAPSASMADSLKSVVGKGGEEVKPPPEGDVSKSAILGFGGVSASPKMCGIDHSKATPPKNVTWKEGYEQHRDACDRLFGWRNEVHSPLQPSQYDCDLNVVTSCVGAQIANTTPTAFMTNLIALSENPKENENITITSASSDDLFQQNQKSLVINNPFATAPDSNTKSFLRATCEAHRQYCKPQNPDKPVNPGKCGILFMAYPSSSSFCGRNQSHEVTWAEAYADVEMACRDNFPGIMDTFNIVTRDSCKSCDKDKKDDKEKSVAVEEREE